MSSTLNLTLMGHVDHGKSSYADSLLASNGLISQRQAGKIRYLDSRQDEQERGITIESSGIRLGFKMKSSKGKDGQPGILQDWTLNLIDTPGHIDFSSEVSTSSRLVDGCLILVDALEGVCTQTINVLRQAWTDRLKPLLVLNKVDRLALEVKMTAAEAEAQLQRVIEQANATLAGFWAEERMQEEEREREIAEAKGQEYTARVEINGQEADAELYFDPPRGNVIFASSMYGFAFRLHSFSHLYSTKLGLPEEKFRNFLWGDWYFDAKGKRMLNRKQASKLWGEGRTGPTACQQFVIDNLWRVFEKTVIERDQTAIEKIVATLSLPINTRDLKTSDSHALLSSVLSSWLPLAPCTFSTIVDQIPTPSAAQGRRLPRILDPMGSVWKADLSRFYADRVGLERPQGRTAVEKDIFAANEGREAWRVAVISKMFAIAKKDLPSETTSKSDGQEDSAEKQRGNIRTMSVEERKLRAKEAREKHEAARRGEEVRRVGRQSPPSAASGAAGEVEAAQPVTNPVEGSTVGSAGGLDGAQVACSHLGAGSAVSIDSSYARAPTLTAPESAESSEPAPSGEEEGSGEVLLAFVRVYSGSLSVSTSAAKSPFFLLMPKYDNSLKPTHASNAKHIKRIHIQALYVIMGKELVKVERVQAGSICAVRGLEGVVGRMGTIIALPEDAALDIGTDEDDMDSRILSLTSPGFVNLTSGAGLAAPIVRVALEPDNPADMGKLVEGLRLLNQSDPCLQTLVQETGEHVIVTAGELHLERCLKDLRERFAKVPISASKPLVPFRETAIRVGEMAAPKFGEEGEARGTVNISIANGIVKLRLRAKPLPLSVTEFLEANTDTMRTLLQKRGVVSGGAEGDTTADVENTGSVSAANTGTSSRVVAPSHFFNTIGTLLQKAGSSARVWEQEWKEEDLVDRIWSFGPRRVGPNLLIGPSEGSVVASGRGLRSRLNARANTGSGLPTPAAAAGAAAHCERNERDERNALSSALVQASLESGDGDEEEKEDKSGSDNVPVSTLNPKISWTSSDLLESLDTGFQIATLQGPLCGEPVRGLAYFIESLTVDATAASKIGLRLSQVNGSLISSVREACRNGLLDWSPRLMMAMYECDIQAAPDVLGKVHGVLNKRRGKITSEEMRDGTAYFTIAATLPVVESFGFADEVRKRTSGAASPQLIFKGFELFDLDPFWVPRTEEELEDLGEKGERENVAKKYMDSVRRRKGMHVDQRIVEAAEKQRNLKSN